MNNNKEDILSGILDTLRNKRLEQLDRFRRNDGIAAGYLCLYTPPEIIDACGAIPLRIIKPAGYEHEIRGSRFIRSDSCSFCKAALSDLAENGLYSCIVSGTTCDQMRRLHEIIPDKTGLPTYLFCSPRTHGKESVSGLFRREIKWITAELTALTGRHYSDESLRQSVNKWNQLRASLKNIHDTRRGDIPAVTGQEMFDLIYAAYFTGPEIFLPAIEDIRHSILHRKLELENPPVRILFAGSILASDDRHIVNIIEEDNRAVIVSDITCTGVRWFYNHIEEQGDIFRNVCDHYHLKMTCPHRRPNDGLYDFTLSEIESLQPDGIIFRPLKFCHAWQFEAKEMKQRFNLPVLNIDTDYSTSNTGQVRTRIQAFIEMIRDRKIRRVS